MRGAVVWIHEEDFDLNFTLGRPHMNQLGYSVDDLLSRARREQVVYEVDVVPEEETTAIGRMKTLRERQFQMEPLDDGIDRDESSLADTPELKAHSPNAVWDVLQQKVEDARAAGMSPRGTEHLLLLLKEHQDVFRLEFGSDPAVKIPPLQVKLRPGARPVTCSVRRYPPTQTEYLEKHTQELKDAGLVYENYRSRWSSAPRIVPKKEPGQFRMTIDTRGVNACTEPMPWPMPHLEVVMSHLKGSQVFFTLDWFRGYWQLPLHEESQELYTFMTHRGMLTPTRVPMGATDAVAYCQGAVQQIFGDLLYKEGNGLLGWLDDLLGHATAETNLLTLLASVFAKCAEFGLKLHPSKCSFFLVSAKWCGKMISAAGIAHCPERVAGLVALQAPQTAADLQQLLCAMNWMRQSLPNYNKLVAPLMALLEQACALSKGRKKTQLVKIPLETAGWSNEHDVCLQQCKEALTTIVPLAHPDDTKLLCLYTDASSDHWGAVLTQIDAQDLERSLHEQAHEPLAFLSGTFKGAESRWPTIEKEAYAVVESCKRLEYLLLRPKGFLIFTDHRNLTYIYDPKSVDSGIQKYRADKLQRWAVVMSTFQYTIQHVAGEDNVWGDLLSRWGAGAVEKAVEDHPVPTMKMCSLRRVAPLQDQEFVWPEAREIAEAQAKAKNQGDQTKTIWSESEKWFKTPQGRVWIPDDHSDLQQRIVIVAHMGASGHRGIKATTKTVEDVFEWKTLRADVKTLNNDCLHCLCTTGDKVPRPYGPTLRATKPNTILHFDYLQLPESEEQDKYVLVLKDGMSGYCELVPLAEATARTTADALEQWFMRYGVVKVWVSDQGTHFKNETIEALRKTLGATHHFVTAYCPWANGAIEVVNRILQRAMKALLSERQLRPNQWPQVLPMVQAVLNHQPADRLGNVAPVTAFLGLPATTPVSGIRPYEEPTDATEAEVSAVVRQHVEDLADALEGLHREVTRQSDRRKETKRQRRAKQVGEPLPKLSIGEYVLVGWVTAVPNKLALRWRGPQRIVKAHNDWTFDVQDLVEPYGIQVYHASRLKRYAEQDREVSQDLKDHIIFADGGHLVENVRACRKLDQEWQLQIKWAGLQEEEVSWEPAKVIADDLPALVNKFCQDHAAEPHVAALSKYLKTRHSASK
jgi:hypothetical protein